MMFNCREITELATEYLDRRLPPTRRLIFRMHLAICRHCRAYVAQLKAVVRAP